ncbi:MAG TPA: hypothetical protein VFF64_09850 [Candidatus Eremiobacteraceae bacterium]|nr:hypothetical protein [Candidatus Eremiobacteraceae bacterium]
MVEQSVPNPIQAPELERMVAVLRKRAEQAKVRLPSKRAVEDALLRLIAHASMTGTAITPTYTRQVLKHFIDAQAHRAHGVSADSFSKMPPEQSGTIEANIRRQDRVESGHDLIFCLQTRDGRNNHRVRYELEVNMRESERERLARWDAYERELARRAKTRKQG